MYTMLEYLKHKRWRKNSREKERETDNNNNNNSGYYQGLLNSSHYLKNFTTSISFNVNYDG